MQRLRDVSSLCSKLFRYTVPLVVLDDQLRDLIITSPTWAAQSLSAARHALRHPSRLFRS